MHLHLLQNNMRASDDWVTPKNPNDAKHTYHSSPRTSSIPQTAQLYKPHSRLPKRSIANTPHSCTYRYYTVTCTHKLQQQQPHTYLPRAKQAMSQHPQQLGVSKNVLPDPECRIAVLDKFLGKLIGTRFIITSIYVIIRLRFIILFFIYSRIKIYCLYN